MPSVLRVVNALCRAWLGDKPCSTYQWTAPQMVVTSSEINKQNDCVQQGHEVDASTGIPGCIKSTQAIKTSTVPFQSVAQTEVALGAFFSFWLSDCFCTSMSFSFLWLLNIGGECYYSSECSVSQSLSSLLLLGYPLALSQFSWLFKRYFFFCETFD